MASAPAPGKIATQMPKTTDMMPAIASSHSCSISWRRRIAAAICITPRTIENAATSSSSASPVVTGLTNVKTPAATPTMPVISSHHGKPAAWPPLNEPAIERMPSANA